jgi:hypothetical protein
MRSLLPVRFSALRFLFLQSVLAVPFVRALFERVGSDVLAAKPREETERFVADAPRNDRDVIAHAARSAVDKHARV